MSHVAKSRIIEEIIIELRRKGLQIPPNVMSNLKSARTLMKVEKVDSKDQGETDPKIDQYISSVEAYAITEASKLFPGEKVDNWLTALDLASCDTCVTIKPKEEKKFIPGVPRDQKWIRVEPISTLPIEKLEKMATENKLDFKREKDGHLVVYGTDENVKIFVKKMTTQANPATKNP
jgi:hypothetical protein